MADTKVSAETLVSEVKAGYKMYIVCDTGAAPDSNAATMTQLRDFLEIVSPPQGRLTVASGTPVPTSNDTGNTTIYYTPYVGRRVPLYDGTRFVMTDVGGELSHLLSDTGDSPAAAAAASVYDVYGWLKNGSPVISRGRAWESTTDRDTGNAITRIEGIYLNSTTIANGPAAQRGTWLGTIETDASSAEVTDSLTHRHLWNAYNQERRALRVVLDFSSGAYSTQTWREMNGSTANRIRFVSGGTAHIAAYGFVGVANSTASARSVRMALALGTTTAPNDGNFDDYMASSATSTILAPLSAAWTGPPGIGARFISMLQWAEGTDTQTWFAVGAGARRHGISATMNM